MMTMVVDYDDGYDYGRIKNLFNLRNLWFYRLKFKPWTSVSSAYSVPKYILLIETP